MGGGTKKALHAWTQAQSCCCIFLKITMDLTRLLLTCMQLTTGTHSSVVREHILVLLMTCMQLTTGHKLRHQALQLLQAHLIHVYGGWGMAGLRQ